MYCSVYAPNLAALKAIIYIHFDYDFDNVVHDDIYHVNYRQVYDALAYDVKC